MQVELEQLVPIVRALYEAEFGRHCPFHLSACQVCMAPTFQYPCPNCDSWADYSDTEQQRQAQQEAVTRRGVGVRHSFVSRVNAKGGLGPWYFSNFKMRVAYVGSRANPSTFGRPEYHTPPDPLYVRSIDRLIEQAAAFTWPDAGLVWDRVTRDRNPLISEDVSFREQRERWYSMSVEILGEVEAARLAKSGFVCPEKRDEKAVAEIIRQSAYRQLECLGLLSNTSSMIP